MHQTNIVGISWRHAQPTALQGYTIPSNARMARLPVLARALSASELVYLATCNRVEVIFVTSDRPGMNEQRSRVITALGGPPDAAPRERRAWRTWRGEAAAEHLFLTAAGLDSAMLGELEIAVQVRDAVKESEKLGLLGPSLAPVFTGALRAARRVQPIIEQLSTEGSLADLAVRHVLDRIDVAPGAVAMVGVSAMTEACARRLAARGVPLLVVNRTVERADDLAQLVGGEARALDAFRDDPDAVEAIVLATGAGTPVLSRSHLERIAARSRTGYRPLIIDFGVQPNVAEADARAVDIVRISIDQLTAEASAARAERRARFTEARVLVGDELSGLRRATSERLVGGVIAQFRLKYQQTALEGLDRLFAHELAGMGDAEQERVRRWAERLAHRFLHAPSVGLRDLAYELGPHAIETFFRHTDPTLVQRLMETSDSARADWADNAECDS